MGSYFNILYWYYSFFIFANYYITIIFFDTSFTDIYSFLLFLFSYLFLFYFLFLSNYFTFFYYLFLFISLFFILNLDYLWIKLPTLLIYDNRGLIYGIYVYYYCPIKSYPLYDKLLCILTQILLIFISSIKYWNLFSILF